MSHMIAATSNEDFIEYEWNREYTLVPADVEDTLPDDAEVINRFSGRWFARLSAPGFTDCTDWYGNNRTEDGALWELFEALGSTEETFYEFLGDGKKIVNGSLSTHGLRNELYGTVAGETAWDKPYDIHLATLGDIDLDEDTGEIFEYDPNDDPDLEEAYEFELVDEDETRELGNRAKNAERDSEEFVLVRVYLGWPLGEWGSAYIAVPAEQSEAEVREKATERTRAIFGQDPVFGELVFHGVLEVGSVRMSWDVLTDDFRIEGREVYE